ncbi:hypothetical protein ACQ4PT_004312 [Festuca glaucescens]
MDCRRRRTTIVLVLLCFYYAPRGASSLSFSLNFSDPSVANRGASIDLTGDAYFSPSRLELTRNALDASIYNNTGRASYVHKVPLWNSATGEMASFTTNFSFQIFPDKNSLSDTGDGMAFFLGHFPSEIPPNSDGGGLGLLPRLPATSTTGKGASRIVAVESTLTSTRTMAWRRHMKTRSIRANEDRSTDSDSEEECVDRADLERGVAAGGLKRYTYRELAAATSNFAEEEKLGRGGFGSVYRGHIVVVGGDQDHLPRPVAVKMLSAESSAQGRKEFEAEVRIISRLKHRNLVQLLGWCDSRKGLLLVYELVAESSLDKHLYSSDRFLTWPQRVNIILGLGSALRYLHGESEQCIVHGDIKPSNIMIDSSLSTKLGDFGLARLVDHGTGLLQTTKAVLGTAGYIDPEFVNTRRPSTESDVYSFGVVLLEIVSGRRPVIETPERTFTLLRWVWSLYDRSAILDAADERL